MSDPYGTPEPPYGAAQQPAYGGAQPGQSGYPGRYSSGEAGYQPGYPPTDPGQPYGYPAHGAQGYGQPYGQPPGHPAPHHGHQQSDDTTWAVMTYVGMLIAGFLAPLIVYFVKRNESQFIRFHAAQCLNAVITSFCYSLGIGLLIAIIAIPSAIADAPAGIVIGAVLGFLVLMGLGITQFVYLVIAAMRSSKYEWYRLPNWMAWPMVK